MYKPMNMYSVATHEGNLPPCMLKTIVIDDIKDSCLFPRCVLEDRSQCSHPVTVDSVNLFSSSSKISAYMERKQSGAR